MKKFIFLLSTIFISLQFYSAPYEDEVKKRLGLLKNKPVVAMTTSENSDSMVSSSRSGESVYNLGCSMPYCWISWSANAWQYFSMARKS